MNQHAFLTILIFKYYGFARTAGVCSRIQSAESNNREFYFKKTFCCDNYEQNGTVGCVECSIGFTSKAGSKCIPCPKTTYGLRCASHCNCKQERCHHIHGCVNNVTEQNFVTMEINTSISKISSALMETSYQTTPVQVLSTETDQKTETATIQITIRAILKKIEKNKDDATKDTELRLSNTAIYCTLGGTVIFIIGLVLSLSYISWKKILAKSIRLHDLSSSIAQVPQIPIEMPNRQSEISEENDYEDIDEDNVIQEPMVSDHETISTSSSTDKSVYGGTDSGGYLHPYHSLVSENNARKSNGAETESIAEDIDLSEYKPYQQVCESMQEQYECTHIKHRNNQNIGMPVQDIHVMTNEYHKYM